jgi:adenylate cyclase
VSMIVPGKDGSFDEKVLLVVFFKGTPEAAVAALAHFVAGDFEEAAACANRALAQSPRFAPTLRVLAASFAKLGRTDDARQAMLDLLRMEPQLTVTTLRGRLAHMDEKALDPFLAALRVAGLPE